MKMIDIVSVKLVREATVPYLTESIYGPDEAWEMVKRFTEDADREMFIVICINV